MANLGDNVPRNFGPAALGHEPVPSKFLKKNGIDSPRKRLIENVENTNLIDFPDRPAFPALDPRE